MAGVVGPTERMGDRMYERGTADGYVSLRDR